MDGRQKRRKIIGRAVRITGWSVLAATLAFVALVAYLYYDYQDMERSRMSGAVRSMGFGQADRTPRWSPDGDYIIANLGNSIYRVEFPGGEITTILEAKGTGYYSLALAPDGRLAYNHYHPENGENVIRILDPTEGRSRTLATTDKLLLSLLSWSPDGTHLLYQQRKGDGWNFLVVRPGDSPDVVWEDDGISWWSGRAVGAPPWSRDGQRVALLKRAGPRVNLVTAHPGSATTMAVDQAGEKSGSLDISAPGWAQGALYYTKNESRDEATHIVLYKTHPGTRDRQLVADMTAQAWTVLGETQSGSISAPGAITELRFETVHHVQPSPDGQRMLLYADTQITGSDSIQSGLYLWEVGEPVLVRLPIQAGIAPASWSPDGQWIAVCDLGLGRLFAVNAEGDDYRLLLIDTASGLS